MNLNLKKPTGVTSPGAAAPKNEIIIIDTETISFFPPTDGKGVVMQGSFALNAGENMATFYSTKSKTSAPMDTEGEEDSQSFKAKFEAQHPGNAKEVKEFVQYWTGKNVVILHKACGDDFYEVMGSPCSPLQLKATKQDNNDGRHWMLGFEPFAKSGFVPKMYYGAVIFADPFAVTSVNTVAVTTANGLQYKLPSLGTTAPVVISTMNLLHDETVTLIGSGGAAPATLPAGVSGVVTVLLVNGNVWVANDKAVINLKVFRAGSTIYLNEVSRG